MKRNLLTDFVLKQGESDGKSVYFVDMTDLDIYGCSPKEDIDGRFYFIININGADVKFYQSGEYPNAFSDEYTTQLLVFAPDDKELNVELHIINDYE